MEEGEAVILKEKNKIKPKGEFLSLLADMDGTKNPHLQDR